MKNFFLHYDFRAPAIGPPAAELYAAALEHCAWGEGVGFDEVVISSHHGCDDDYGPAPLVAATAIAARTRRLRIAPVLALPLYHPIHVAEEVAVLDLVSGGRVELVVGAGYRPSEFAMFGGAMAERARRMEEAIPALRAAWRGEPFEFRGRTVLVRPRPARAGGPAIVYAGFSPPAARRAARLADAFMPMPGSDAVSVYTEACRELGREPVLKRRVAWMFLHVTHDPERAWARLAPHLLHVSNSYARWMSEAGTHDRGLHAGPGRPRAPGDRDLSGRDARRVSEARRRRRRRDRRPTLRRHSARARRGEPRAAREPRPPRLPGRSGGRWPCPRRPQRAGSRNSLKP